MLARSCSAHATDNNQTFLSSLCYAFQLTQIKIETEIMHQYGKTSEPLLMLRTCAAVVWKNIKNEKYFIPRFPSWLEQRLPQSLTWPIPGARRASKRVVNENHEIILLYRLEVVVNTGKYLIRGCLTPHPLWLLRHPLVAPATPPSCCCDTPQPSLNTTCL